MALVTLIPVSLRIVRYFMLCFVKAGDTATLN
jgi:hypothetical protein